jgi:quercetin dioxygenase-like cupin family protein
MSLDGVQSLGSLVDYQAGSIVSRQILKGGSVTAFAFDAGEGLSEHTTPHEALLQVIDGTARVEIAGVAHAVGAGEIIHLPAGVPHAVQAEERFQMLLVMIRTEV